MQRMLSTLMPSMFASCFRNRWFCCDAVHTVRAPSLYSATAHEGPIEPCVWIAKSYVADTLFAPAVLSASGASPTF